MKLKRQYSTYFTNPFKGCKVFLAPILLLTVFMAEAQEVSVVATDAVGAEVASTGVSDGIIFAITRDATDLSSDTEVSYTLSGTATEGADYSALTGTVTIGAGAGGTVEVEIDGIEDDALVEGDETLIFTIDNVDNGNGVFGAPTISATQNSAEAIITDDDFGIVTLDIVNTTYVSSVDEDGNWGQFRPVLDKKHGFDEDLTVTYEITGTATDGVDYDLTNAVDLTYSTTQDWRNIRVAPVDDLEFEGDETVVITLLSTSNPLYTIGSSSTATITIVDNDCAAGTDAPVLNTSTLTERCDDDSVDLNTFIVGEGANAPIGSDLVWSAIPLPVASADLILSTVTASGTYYAAYWDDANSCASASIEVTLTMNNTPSAGVTTNASACNNADPVFVPREIDLDDLITGQDIGEWAQIGNAPVVTISANHIINFDDADEGDYEFEYTTTGAILPCVNVSTSVTITVSNCDPCTVSSLAPVLNTTQTVFCGEIPDTVSLSDYAANTGPNNNPLKWSSSQATPISGIVSDALVSNPGPGVYYGFYYDEINACVSPLVTLTLSSKTIPTVDTTAEAERCGPGLVTLTATVSDNATINWYLSENSNTILDAGGSFEPLVTETTTYWVEATLNECSSERVAVVATVVVQPSAGITQNGGIASACSDASNGPSILDLDDLITGQDTGAWAFTSGPSGQSISIPSNNIINFQSTLDGDYVFTYTTSGAQLPCVDESSIITISVNDCDIDTDLDGLYDGTEATLGTDPNSPDTDGDGVNDNEEVGIDISNPLDEDEDGLIDALDSNILDDDLDGVVNQLDPANENACIPNTLNGICDSDTDGITDSDEDRDGSDPLSPCDPDPENAACNAEVDLEVLKSVDDINALVGDTVVFTITVNNLSENTASTIIIGDLLESGFEYVTHAPFTETYDALMGEWSIPVLAGLSSIDLNITVNILDSGIYTNTAELLDVFQVDINSDNDRSPTITLPIILREGVDLALEKTVISSTPLVNDDVIFTLKVTNESADEFPVTNIEVEDFISSGSGFVYIDHNTNTGTYNSDTGLWFIESLEEGEEVTLEIRVSVPNEGQFTNTAVIQSSVPSDSNLDNNEASADVDVSLPSPADVGFVFNQFSPNADGTNDVLRINTVNQETNLETPIIYNIQIFNRYGNLVFEAIDKTDSEVWDGSWKGKEAPEGTYFYTMKIDLGEGSEPKKGWIQLIR